MESFAVFVEKNTSNPLRKKALEGTPTNKEFIDQKIAEGELSPEDAKKLKNLQDANVDPEFIDRFRQSKIATMEQELRNTYLRSKITSQKYSKILDMNNIQVFQDKEHLTFDISKDAYTIRMIKYCLTVMLRNLRGLFPIRRPRIIITDIKKILGGKNIFKTGQVETPPAFYQDRIIYIDINSIDEPDYYIHEYAHYIVDLVPKQTEALLIREYEALLDNYFRSIKKKKRSNLEPKDFDDEKSIREAAMWRKRIAQRLGFPTEYAATNFDEFWAEIITHWNSMPINKNTYRFKTIAKKVMTRLN